MPFQTYTTDRRRKACRKCGAVKPLTGFYVHKRDGVQSVCKNCQDKRNQGWLVAHPDKRKEINRTYGVRHRDRRLASQQEYGSRPEVKAKKRAEWLLSRYGMSAGQVASLVEAQQGRCLICHIEIGDSFHVDHDHVTGQFRGLLCGLCNRGLGMFRDNPTFLKTAAVYLEERGAK